MEITTKVVEFKTVEINVSFIFNGTIYKKASAAKAINMHTMKSETFSSVTKVEIV